MFGWYTLYDNMARVTDSNGHLHEEAGEEALADVRVVVARVEVCGLELEPVTVHHAHQLRPHLRT